MTTQLDRIEEKLDQIIAMLSVERGKPVTPTHDKVLIAISTRRAFKVADVLHCGPSKQVYNVLGYLTRRGKIRRVGYGEYETSQEH